jgi:ATP-dependent DNA helicase RecG
MMQAQPMLRLVQGDVGSGKTLVAARAALDTIAAGYQVAFMAPTELLAEQHYANLEAWFLALEQPVTWLSGRTKGKARKDVLHQLASGTASIVVGTHALFQDDVQFQKLGLIIVDEQHRFGVHQRLSLADKGAGEEHPHQLALTATPIPRSLAMVAYGDLDCSIIDELPPGRQPVTTTLMDHGRRDAVIRRVGVACREGRQAYWVCTAIEESDALDIEAAEATLNQLREALPDVPIGLVHGKLKPADKASVMAAFKAGDVQLLVATTVIEVGVDVPNASLMIIDNAERLGLAQLHQLRGRVGRGAVDSHCLLLFRQPLSETAQQRLKVMQDSNDGFVIAEADLNIRGPGELLGTRQTGLAAFRVALLPEHESLLIEAQTIAADLYRSDPDRARALMQRWAGARADFARV